MKMTVKRLAEDDRDQWEALYHDYAAFYQMPMDSDILDTVWSWIFDSEYPFYALIAKDDKGNAIGLAHCREMPSPLRGAFVGFLDDLYVKPDCRGSDCVQSLYDGLRELGEEKDWPFIRWITAEDNYRARTSYDKVAEKTHWITYQMPVE